VSENRRMTDMDLQARCIEFGARYVADMFPDLQDLERRAYLQNAAANGFAAGWRDAMTEVLKDVERMQKTLEKGGEKK